MNIDYTEIHREHWIPLPNNRPYAVSTLGRVAHISNGSIRLVSVTDNGKGYKLIGTGPRSDRKNYYVHRLVAQAFIPNPDGLPEVNHKDGNKSNNRVDNLEWVSLQQNRDHAVATGLILRGEKSPASKLKESDVVAIVNHFLQFPNDNKSAVARKYGVQLTTIIKILTGKRWKRVTDPIFRK
jgi:hypothetical protein